ncbi:MAG: hypothetical protein KC609_09360 [Myxococcales bacterium]|nr:hypothetical protein [Myxococcales bacterium]
MLRFDVGAVVVELHGEPLLLAPIGSYLRGFESDLASEVRIVLRSALLDDRQLLPPENEICVLRPGLGADERRLEFRHRHLEARYDPGEATLSVTLSTSESARFRFFFQLLLRAFLAEWLIDNDGFALHAASVVRDERAYLFVGQSGAGKSTVVRRFADGRALNDDFSAVRRRVDRFVAAGTPIHTRADFEFLAQRRVVAAVMGLVQSRRLQARWLSASDFLPRLVPHVHCFSADPAAYRRALTTCSEFVSSVRCAMLDFNLRDDIWREIDATDR